ncbi:MAG: MipA/OmpV family protein [Ectothiorhodospiraceae bacterium]|nr:MipA/OmpV family protein [Ectothiorhodospiraceae bacterium]MCH8506926.1 MipA/OmpV family protein [Ectothiorhodospiraceae bacterium]
MPGERLARQREALLLMWVLVCLLPSADAMAEGPRGLFAGGGVFVNQTPYQGDNTSVMPLPFVTWRGERWSVFGPAIGYQAYRGEALTLGGALRWRSRPIGGRFRGEEIAGIKRRDTVEAGLDAVYRLPGRGIALRLSTGTDLLGRHDGSEVNAGVRFPRRVGPVFGSLELGVNWQSSQYASYHWGVARSEATADREAYSPGSVVNPRISLNGYVFLSERSSIFMLYQYTWLASDVQRSPIVSQDHQWMTMAAWLYRF